MPPIYLDPKQALDIAPAAERNVERMSSCCLDINGKAACIVKARGGGAWWMIWIIMMCLVLGAPMCFLDGDIQKGLQAYSGLGAVVLVGFGISLYVWPIRVWRTHIPLRFSRKTRKVYFHWKGKTYIEDWDSIRAYLRVQAAVSGVGAPFQDPNINLEFHEADGSLLTINLMGTHKLGLTPEEKAAAFWEYIRRYMEDGPESVPAPDMDIWKPVEKKDLLKVHWPFPIIHNPEWWFWPIDIALFPARVIFYLISTPTEFLYYHLEKRMKVDPFPPEMEEAGQCQ